jgi:5-deoxy-D-glucuronate isomerase
LFSPGRNDIIPPPRTPGITRKIVHNHRFPHRPTARVLIIVEVIETTPDGMFSSADVFASNPKLRIRVVL